MMYHVCIRSLQVYFLDTVGLAWYFDQILYHLLHSYMHLIMGSVVVSVIGFYGFLQHNKYHFLVNLLLCRSSCMTRSENIEPDQLCAA